jgi:hypothetical protein
LRDRVRQQQRPSRWLWWLTGTVRVPEPVGDAALVLIAQLAFGRLPAFDPAPPEASVTLADFEPVDHIEPVLVGDQR